MAEYNPIFPVNINQNEETINVITKRDNIIPVNIVADTPINIEVTPENIDVEMEVNSSGLVNIALLGNMGGNCSKIFYKTTAEWNRYPGEISQAGAIYIYSDYMEYEGRNVAGFKVGDGLAYIVDLPFIDKVYSDHVKDAVRHITQTEREFWNNKVRCYISETNNQRLVFTTH